MSVAWSAYRPGVELYAPQVPLPLVVYHLREAARDFCERSKIWREALALQDLTINVRDYTLTPPTDAAIVTAITVEAKLTSTGKREQVLPNSEWALDDAETYWRTDGTQTRRYYQRTRETLSLSWDPTETVTNGLFVVAALKPDPDATGGADMLYNHWHEAIERGALFRILTIPGEPWSNPDKAAGFGMLYEQDVMRAGIAAEQSHTHKPELRFRPQSYGI